MVKKYMKGVSVILLCGIFVFAHLPQGAFAAKESPDYYDSKDEVIYGKLHETGKTESMYVVNTFHVQEPGEIIDYGDYTDVRNLTDLSPIDMESGDEVSFEASDSEFYYQGMLKEQPLPWDISIRYFLDGKRIEPSELPGKSGEIKIEIKTKENSSVDSVFFDYYLQQISVTMDPAIFSDIQAPKGTKANEGKNQLVTFSILPGEEEDLILTADVENFELDPIEINALPANLAIDSPDFDSLTGDFETLSDAIEALHAGTSELNEGISELNDGTSELSNGSSDYRSGINQLNEQSGELINGSKQIKNALNQLNEEVNVNTDMPDLDELEKLPEGIQGFAKGLREAASGIRELKEGYEEAYHVLDESIAEIPDLVLSDDDMKALKESDLDDETVEELIELNQSAQMVKATFQEVDDAFKQVPETLDEVIENVNTIADEVEIGAKEIESGLNDFDPEGQIQELQNGIATMNNEYNTFHEGLIAYTDGVGTLSTSYEELDDGIQSLNDNVPELANGSSELNDGVGELREETKDLPDEVESEIEEALDEFDFSDFEPVSYVSDKNKDVNVVQFVLQTESIELPDDDDEDDSDEEESSDSIWQRFLNLFGL